ncbi:exocyst complex component EXO70H1-like [Lycium barbarum]|uniref:exocyst complex component EXO70H1-like n=1 Tax=Lycium barbarum TaxID=112863 RepID=UPI00293E69C0|nr:exocyst complex component EXO70H1-like [Lycium barbarum]
MRSTGYFSPPRPSSPLRSSITSNNSPSRHITTFSESLMEDTINDAGSIIRRWDLDASTSYNRVANLFRDYREEAQQLLDAVNNLQHCMHFVIKEKSSSGLLVQAQTLMQIAMKRLQKEMYTILSGNRYFLDSETLSTRSSRQSTRSSVSDDDNDDEVNEITNTPDTEVSVSTRVSEVEKVSELVMQNLKAIADCMIGAGYGKECVKIYNLNRKSVIDETLYYLGVEKLTTSQIQKMDWDVLEKKIKNWLSAVKIAVSTLFHGEKILCDHVFSASDAIRESCFSEIVKESALNLFSFPEMVAQYKKLTLEKMFTILDLYNSISDLWDDIQFIFSFDSLAVIKSQAVTSLVKLGEAARFMLAEFELAIQKDSSKAKSGGGVHPLTRYVMNYLVFLGDYSFAFSEIIADFPLSIQTPLPESYADDSLSSVRIAWIILVLLCKLDGKAQHYKDVSLSYLFLANNLNYVVSKVKKSNLKLLLGSDWLSKNETKVKLYISNYERMGWTKVLTSFPENSTVEMSLPEARDWFIKFNLGFEEAYHMQSSWVIPDPKLRDEVKISLARKIVSGYQTFYLKYRELLRSGGAKSVVRFAPDDLQNYLSDLFYGTGLSEHGTTSYDSPSSSTSISTSSSPSHGR